jgi:hypothetical protein
MAWAWLAGLATFFFGYVLQARSLNLQFLKTAFFLNETQPSEKEINRFRFFSRF